MEAVVISLYQTAQKIERLLKREDHDSLIERFDIFTSIGTIILFLLRFFSIESVVGDVFAAMIIIGATDKDSFYHSMLRTLSLFVLTVVDTSTGDMDIAYIIYYSLVALLACMHTQLHLQ